MSIMSSLGLKAKKGTARLYLSDAFWEPLQAKVLAYNGLRGLEQRFNIYCRRVWHDGRPAFYPVEAFIPKHDDYDIQTETRVRLKPEAFTKVMERLHGNNLHLLDGHTHPSYGLLEPSTADRQRAEWLGLELQEMHGQRQLITTITNQMVELSGMHIELRNGTTLEPIEVVRCARLPQLGSDEFVRSGSLMKIVHRCPKPVLPVLLSQQLNLPHSEIVAEVWGGDADNKVLLRTDPDLVMVRVVQWSRDCNCGKRLSPGEVVSWSFIKR